VHLIDFEEERMQLDEIGEMESNLEKGRETYLGIKLECGIKCFDDSTFAVLTACSIWFWLTCRTFTIRHDQIS